MRPMDSLPDSLRVLAHAVQEGRLMFRDRAALEAHQQRLTTRQLPWLVAHSSYTAVRFREAGLRVADWRELPPISKPEMMANFDALNTAGLRLEEVLRVARRAEASRDFTPLVSGWTGAVTAGLSSGTSGTQGAFVVSRAERVQWAGVMLRRLLPSWPGSLVHRQRVAFLLRAEGGLYRTVQSRRIDFRFLDLLRPLSELAADLSRFDPTVLVGPPSVLTALLGAGAIARPERVVSVAEVLEDDDRMTLEQGFGPVVQVYQATEGLLALPCALGHLHLNEAHLHFDFEALGEGHLRPILTDLRRRTQPVVRHRLDDLLQLSGDCPCGLAARRVERIVGRQDDALLLPGSSGGPVTVWPDFVRAAMNQVPGLREYRVNQTGPEEIRVALDPDTSAGRVAGAHALKEALGRVKVRTEEVHLTFESLSVPGAGEAVPRAKRRRVSRSWSP